MKHRLAVEFQSGVFVASCSCGGWATSLAPHASERASGVYDRIEEAHRLHAEEVGPGRLPPGRGRAGDRGHFGG